MEPTRQEDDTEMPQVKAHEAEHSPITSIIPTTTTKSLAKAPLKSICKRFLTLPPQTRQKILLQTYDTNDLIRKPATLNGHEIRKWRLSVATHQIWVTWWTKTLRETDVQIAAEMGWVREQWKQNHQALLDDWTKLWKFKDHYLLYDLWAAMLGFGKSGCLDTKTEMAEFIDVVVGMLRAVGENTRFSKTLVVILVGGCRARMSTWAGF